MDVRRAFSCQEALCFHHHPGKLRAEKLNITLMVKTTQEKRRVLLTLWVAGCRVAAGAGDWLGVQKGECFLKSLTLGI